MTDLCDTDILDLFGADDPMQATWVIATKLKVKTSKVLRKMKDLEGRGLVKKNVHSTRNNCVWERS